MEKALQPCRSPGTRLIQGSASIEHLVTNHLNETHIIIVKNEKLSSTLFGVEGRLLAISEV